MAVITGTMRHEVLKNFAVRLEEACDREGSRLDGLIFHEIS